MTRCAPLFVPLLFLSVIASLHAEDGPWTVEQDADGVTVQYEGEVFTRYEGLYQTKPILFPIVGPGGAEMTRGYPMRDALATEKADHPHHRSFWWTHGDVDGVSFWHEGEGAGLTEHREFLSVSGGKSAVITTRNDWLSLEKGEYSKKHLEDVRTVTCRVEGENRIVDFSITLTAGKIPVKFGDTKEGSFGVRVPGTMKVDSKLGGKIVSSEGLEDGAAWGKEAAWVDYHGPVGNKTLGIAILNHPSSFRYPTAWHVRTYGLFAANPFGYHDFKIDKEGAYELAPGKSISFHYRVIFHPGDEKAAGIAEAFEKYAAQRIAVKNE